MKYQMMPSIFGPSGGRSPIQHAIDAEQDISFMEEVNKKCDKNTCRLLTEDEISDIEKQIQFYKDKEKELKCPCLYLLKITNLQNKLFWDHYLKNGLSEEDKKIFNEINFGS